MKYSIIIPVYNREKYIKKSIESLISQRVNKEIIIVDNKSNDSSKSICKAYEDKYDFIRVYDCVERGESNARNIGLKQATGDIVCFCDSDDYYEENALYEINELFEKNDVDIVISSFYQETYGKKEKYIMNRNRKNDVFYNFFGTPCGGSVWNKFYKRDVIRDIEFNKNIILGPDTYFNAEILSRKKNIKIYKTNILTYNYVIHDSNISNDNNVAFDEHNNSNQVKTLELIKKNLRLNSNDLKYVNYLIAQIALDEVIKTKKHTEKQKKLKSIIHKYIFDFLCYKNNELLKYKTLKLIKYFINNTKQ